jgi:hypothetical protein
VLRHGFGGVGIFHRNLADADEHADNTVLRVDREFGLIVNSSGFSPSAAARRKPALESLEVLDTGFRIGLPAQAEHHRFAQNVGKFVDADRGSNAFARTRLFTFSTHAERRGGTRRSPHCRRFPGSTP